MCYMAGSNGDQIFQKMRIFGEMFEEGVAAKIIMNYLSKIFGFTWLYTLDRNQWNKLLDFCKDVIEEIAHSSWQPICRWILSGQRGGVRTVLCL